MTECFSRLILTKLVFFFRVKHVSKSSPLFRNKVLTLWKGKNPVYYKIKISTEVQNWSGAGDMCHVTSANSSWWRKWQGKMNTSFRLILKSRPSYQGENLNRKISFWREAIIKKVLNDEIEISTLDDFERLNLFIKNHWKWNDLQKSLSQARKRFSRRGGKA